MGKLFYFTRDFWISLQLIGGSKSALHVDKLRLDLQRNKLCPVWPKVRRPTITELKRTSTGIPVFAEIAILKDWKLRQKRLAS